MSPILFTLGSHPLAPGLALALDATPGEIETRRFPDGETYLRVATDVADRACVVLVDLSRPDDKFLSVAFLADTLVELGARSVGLVAPYLSYMRQDRRFVDGEAITSRLFARMVSSHVNWLVTVDPHLHRYHDLGEIYSIPTAVVQAAPVFAAWLQSRTNVFLVGPDAESEQWVSGIAAISGHPYMIGDKVRKGDHDVTVTLPALGDLQTKTAIIIDDVISSGHTILKCAQALREKGVETLECAAVHGIFAEQSDARLKAAGIDRLVTCNTIPHASNEVDVGPLVMEAASRLISDSGRDE